jgi:hypothetical protein
MIKIIRLNSGEELIAETKIQDLTYILSNVSIIIPTEKGVGLMDFMAYSTVPDKGLEIKSEFVAFTSEPVEGLLKQYKSIYSKIITPSQGLIT